MHPYLNIAVRAARSAGKVITRYLEKLDSIPIYEKGFNDLVTEVDKTAEAVIIETIYKAYPDHGVLGEETGNHPGNEFTWVIDPLDGTMNFVHGFPQFAVSIAIKQKGYIEHGVIYDPISQDLYTASRGAGAQLNERRIRVSTREGLKGALIGTAFPMHFRDGTTPPHELRFLPCFEKIYRSGAEMRKIGCASLNLAYVASGKLDGFWEPNLKEWDIAAGVLIVREAGGFVSDFKGENGFLESGNILAGTRKVHGELLEIFK